MTDELALADLDRIAKWSIHRASRTTRDWLEPALANVRAALTDNEGDDE